METNFIILPNELIEGILIRLRVRDLLRLRCVSKSWHALTDDPNFVSTHYNHQYELLKEECNVPILLGFSPYGINYQFDQICRILYRHQGDDDDNVIVNLTYDLERDTKIVLTCPERLHESRVDVKCVGVANGIVCISIRYDEDDVEKVCCGLWNPATRDFKRIMFPETPDTTSQLTYVVCFGFDRISNDFKIVRAFHPISSNEPPITYELYSLKNNCWKRLPFFHCYIHSYNMDSCLNGVHYRVANSVMDTKYHLISFNLNTEVFKVLKNSPQCLDIPEGKYIYRRFDIGVYRDNSLALMFTREVDNIGMFKIDIWLATKFDSDDNGVPSAWQCLWVIDPFHGSLGDPKVWTSPIDGKLLLKTTTIDDDGQTKKDKWSLYDPVTRNITKDLDLIRWLHISYRYVESLFRC